MGVVEILMFKLAAGTTDRAFLDSDRAVQTEFVPNLPGFLRRTTAKGPAGDWLVVTLWSDVGSADSSRSLEESSPVVQRFLEHIDGSSVTQRRYVILD